MYDALTLHRWLWRFTAWLIWHQSETLRNDYMDSRERAWAQGMTMMDRAEWIGRRNGTAGTAHSGNDTGRHHRCRYRAQRCSEGSEEEMMTDIKPCPFCGRQPVMTTDERPQVWCDVISCVGPIADSVDEWNTRPIEDAHAARIADLEAEIAALRPWARIGKRAIAEHWHVVDITGDGWINHLRCCGAQAWGETDAVHAPDCPIPALLAQLEAADA